MEAFLNLSLPTDWQSLSDSQLQYFFTQLSHDLPMEEILTLCLFKWADLRMLCRTPNGSYLVMRRHAPKEQACLSVREVQTAICTLDYLRHFSDHARPHHAHRQGTSYRQGLLGSAILDIHLLRPLLMKKYPLSYAMFIVLLHL